MLELLLPELIKAAVSTAREYLLGRYPPDKLAARIDESSMAQAIEHHLLLVQRWAEELAYTDMAAPKRLADNYIDLDLNIEPARYRGRKAGDRTRKVSSLPELDENLVLLGDPGAGKTTSLKRLATALLSPPEDSRAPRRVPLLVRLRTLSSKESAVDHLLSVIGVNVDVAGLSPQRKKKEKQEVLTRLLGSLRAYVIFDGLDEARGDSAISNFAQEISELLYVADVYRVVVACRSGAYVYALPNAGIFELSPLSDAQVREFAGKWLGEKKATQFIREIRNNPYTGSETRPLTLSHLCAIFEKTGRVPEKPKSVYKLILHLYIRDWDMHRAIQRPSKYADFELDRKEEFLEALAYVLTINGVRGWFEHGELQNAYLQICTQFGLPERDSSKVAREIESHTGLVTQVGHEMYEFAHKSLQEYLTAQYIVRLPSLPAREVVRGMPSEMAIAVAISSRPSQYFASSAVSMLPSGRISDEDFGVFEFVSQFLSRLVLERPDFVEDPALACALVLLLGHAYHNRPATFKAEAQSQLNHTLEGVISLRGVKGSFERLHENASMVARGSECVVDLDYYFLERNDPAIARMARRVDRPTDVQLPLQVFKEAGLLTKRPRR